MCVWERESDLFFWARKGGALRDALGSLSWCPLDPQFHRSFGETDGAICSAFLRFLPDRRGHEGEEELRNGSDWSGGVLYWASVSAQWVCPPFAFAFVPHLVLIAPPWRPAGCWLLRVFFLAWPHLLTNWKTVCVCDSVQYGIRTSVACKYSIGQCLIRFYLGRPLEKERHEQSTIKKMIHWFDIDKKHY